MPYRSKIQRRLAYVFALFSLAGCASVKSLTENDKFDYRSAAATPSVSLDVPPDLTQLQRDNRYAIPEANSGTATASTYNAALGSRVPDATSTTPVAPKTIDNMRIERDGKQRWLVVKQPPDVLWPQLKDFWRDNGFLINIDSPQTGVMETDWTENRAQIPEDIIRRTLGKVLDSLYSTGERDKFRTRIERATGGTTEIYISHRGAQEVVQGSRDQNQGTLWTARASDPELEAEFLSRLMARLGADPVLAKTAVAGAQPQQLKAKLRKDGNSSFVEVDEAFDRAWRRVGLALDRVGFTVEDRDRGMGVYFVRYVDQDAEAQKKAGKGFFSNLFSLGSSDDKLKAQRYRILVQSTGANSQVSVRNNEGQPETSTTGDKILSLLNEQLK